MTKEQITNYNPNTNFVSLEEESCFSGTVVRKYKCHNTLLEGIKAQAAANLRIVNEIIDKADAFDKEYKPKKVSKNKKKK